VIERIERVRYPQAMVAILDKALEGGALTLEDVRGAAKLANIDSFIGSLNAGYNTVIGDEGMNLSGGERQRTAIARAVVMGPSILLADEPTGNLDTHSGGEIIELIEKMNKTGLTLIVVTHDPSIGKRARRIIRLQDGMIVNGIE